MSQCSIRDDAAGTGGRLAEVASKILRKGILLAFRNNVPVSSVAPLAPAFVASTLLGGPKNSGFSHKEARGALNIYHRFLLLTRVLLIQGAGSLPTGRAIPAEVFPCFAASPSNLHCGCVKCSFLGSESRETAPFLLAPGAPPGAAPPRPFRQCFGSSLFRNQAHIGPIVTGGSPHSISNGELQALKSPSR